MTISDRQRWTSYPDDWSSHIGALIGSTTLDVAGFSTTIEITEAELVRVFFPLLANLDNLQQSIGARILAGLAGIPGSGKSTFAAALARIADIVLPADHFVVVGMDGWHWPNEELDRRTICDQVGNRVPLRQRKGGPDSFDVAAMAESLRKLKNADHDLKLPIYDRRRHDPIPEAMTIFPKTRIILIEGNYLLSKTSPWDRVSALLDPKLLLECSSEVARDRIITRHIRGGLDTQQAGDKYERNDRANIDFVLTSGPEADAIIRLGPEPGIRGS